MTRTSRTLRALRREGVLRKKPGPTAKDRAKKRRETVLRERDAKQDVRERDKHCRFPLCGCQLPGADFFKRQLTVSHDFHKGMGGDPEGKVSIPALMIALCKWRHQDAPVSRDKKTMRTVYLTPDQSDGPLAFEVDLRALYPEAHHDREAIWFEVAREEYTNGGTLRLASLTYTQLKALEDLREMTR